MGVTPLVLIVFACSIIGPQPALLSAVYLAVVTAILVVFDLTQRRLPNVLVLPCYLIVCCDLLWLMQISSERAIVALSAGALAMTATAVLWSFGGMGMGDVKLSGVLGCSLGCLGPHNALIGCALPYLLGGFCALFLCALSPVRRGLSIPFGPFMLVGYWGALAL